MRWSARRARPRQSSSHLREYPCPARRGKSRLPHGRLEIVTRARYARLLQPRSTFAFERILPPRLPGTGAGKTGAYGRRKPSRALRADGADSKQLRGRVRFDESKPDFIWWVTGEGFRVAPAGSDPSKLDIGAGRGSLSGTETPDELKSKTQRNFCSAPTGFERLRGGSRPRMLNEPKTAAPESELPPHAVEL